VARLPHSAHSTVSSNACPAEGSLAAGVAPSSVAIAPSSLPPLTVARRALGRAVD
jgi:hypothetical protein